MNRPAHPMRWSTSLEGLQVEVLDTRFGPIEIAHAGQGPSVFLIHGIPGSWRQAMPLAEDLASRYRVLLASRPGYGATPISDGRTTLDQADMFAEVLDVLGIDRCAVIGISGGGPPAVAFAKRHPGRTSALILACALVGHLMKPPTQMRFLLGIPLLGKVVSFATRANARRKLRNPRAVERAILENLTEDEKRLVAENPMLAQDLLRFALSHLDAPAGLRGMRNDLREIDRARNSPPIMMAGITSPTLIMHGDSDPAVPLDHAHFYARSMPHAELVVYEKAGHLFLFTHREEATSRITAFLEKTSGLAEED